MKRDKISLSSTPIDPAAGIRESLDIIGRYLILISEELGAITRYLQATEPAASGEGE